MNEEENAPGGKSTATVTVRGYSPEESQLIEKLAALEHEQWTAWSRDLASKEKLSETRIARWAGLWVPYEQLSEEMKEHDRKWARMALDIVGAAVMASLMDRIVPETDV